ncbi:PTS-dependent dihydroxyacetone kinase phosphotransferase subunit DhaM [Streptomyces sp. ST2-7A]|uniref:PTS-dependent dihydroxyacetone kinase phosphotransferase subunit DhaM n=1 Tax=Streptomyces sp. ST2-7A TaxID=2907214 RepID=UPI001F1E4EED|nr:PTS fructose transporter subunit IIA [Streptomyces sp. ST2-7A]MCE7079350.1 PTS fructose transporter subunit IIA [Streptomyces sp. ST2-7A]
MAETGGESAGAPGIVLVSHSREVAESVARLAAALAGGAGNVRVEPAGGDPGGGIGTDAELITAAARRADSGAGVAVLVDLGSAVLTVRALLAEPREEDGEAAGDDPTEGLPVGTRLLDAPFLEGAVAAVVAAAGGADLEGVVEAAGEARDYRKR